MVNSIGETPSRAVQNNRSTKPRERDDRSRERSKSLAYFVRTQQVCWPVALVQSRVEFFVHTIWTLGLAIVGFSCRTPATDIRLVLDTDAPDERAVDLEIFSFVGRVLPSELESRASTAARMPLRLTRDPSGLGSFTNGGSIGILPPLNRETSVTVWIRATFVATQTFPEVRTDRTAQLSFVPGRSGTARVFLPVRCGDRSTNCSSVAEPMCTVSIRCREQNTTCGDFGECVAPQLGVEYGTPDGGVVADTGPGLDIDASVGRLDGGEPTPAVPQQIAPKSLANVSKRRPTFRWKLPAVFDGAVLDLCRDRACSMLIETLRVTGTLAQPSADLPARSVVFWRVRGRRRAVESTNYSPTWLFHVAAENAPSGVDISYQAHNDVNGDGFDDLFVGSPNAKPSGRIDAGIVTIFHGSAMGISRPAARVLEGLEAGHTFGNAIANAGDVNGDGFGDLLIGAYPADPDGRLDAGTSYLYLGSPTGIGPNPAQVLSGATAGDGFGRSVSTAGDVNLDGYDDIVIGSWTASAVGRAGAGQVSVFHGSARGISAISARVIQGAASGDQLGHTVSHAGDVNRDGFDDIALSAPLASPGGVAQAGTVYIYHGGPSGIGTTFAQVLDGASAMDQLGRAVARAGDVNSDGVDDLLVGSWSASRGGNTAGVATIYYGALGGLSSARSFTILGTVAGAQFGKSVTGLGDVNGDGISDLAISSNLATVGGRANVGFVNIYHGNSLGISTTPSRTIEGVSMGDRFGTAVGCPGDINGDSFGDLVVGAVTATALGRTGAGTVSLFYGSAGGIGAMPSLVLNGLSTEEHFGATVACFDRTVRESSHPIRSMRLRADLHRFRLLAN